jgi:hypothetical protein
MTNNDYNSLKFTLESQVKSIDIGEFTYYINFQHGKGYTVLQRKKDAANIPTTKWQLVLNIVGGLEFRHTLHCKGFETMVFTDWDGLMVILLGIKNETLRIPKISSKNIDVTDK